MEGFFRGPIQSMGDSCACMHLYAAMILMHDDSIWKVIGWFQYSQAELSVGIQRGRLGWVCRHRNNGVYGGCYWGFWSFERVSNQVFHCPLGMFHFELGLSSQKRSKNLSPHA